MFFYHWALHKFVSWKKINRLQKSRAPLVVAHILAGNELLFMPIVVMNAPLEVNTGDGFAIGASSLRSWVLNKVTFFFWNDKEVMHLFQHPN